MCPGARRNRATRDPPPHSRDHNCMTRPPRSNSGAPKELPARPRRPCVARPSPNGTRGSRSSKPISPRRTSVMRKRVPAGASWVCWRRRRRLRALPHPLPRSPPKPRLSLTSGGAALCVCRPALTRWEFEALVRLPKTPQNEPIRSREKATLPWLLKPRIGGAFRVRFNTRCIRSSSGSTNSSRTMSPIGL